MWVDPVGPGAAEPAPLSPLGMALEAVSNALSSWLTPNGLPSEQHSMLLPMTLGAGITGVLWLARRHARSSHAGAGAPAVPTYHDSPPQHECDALFHHGTVLGYSDVAAGHAGNRFDALPVSLPNTVAIEHLRQGYRQGVEQARNFEAE